MTDVLKPDEPGDPPITAKTILAAALAGTDLPALGEQSTAAWAAQFTNEETARRAGELLHACAIADVAAARHWAHQTEDAYLRSQIGGKPPTHR